jgi:hypothetical protein
MATHTIYIDPLYYISVLFGKMQGTDGNVCFLFLVGILSCILLVRAFTSHKGTTKLCVALNVARFLVGIDLLKFAWI